MTTSASNDALHKARTSSNAEARIVAIGVVTIALYIVNYYVQGSIFQSGLSSSIPAGGPRGWGPAGQTAAYAAITAALFCGYLAVLAMVKRGELTRGRALFWALLVPCIVNLLLLPGRPWLSQDVFSYMAHGFLGVAPDSNPFLQPAEAAADTAIGPALSAYGWHGQIGITPYGIVWTWIEKAVMRLSGDNLFLAMVLLKFVVVAASLGTAYFIWSFLGRTSPSTQILGVLAYLWNPMILAEFAGEGHNDALIVLFVIAALAACAAGRPAASMVAQMLGILTKYISLMFCPAQLVFFWRTRRGVARLALEVAAALAFVGAIAIALYSHLWAGSHTFDGLLRRAQPISSASPFGAVNWILRRSPLASVAAPLTVACVTLPLLALVAWVSWKVRDAADLARAFAWISLGYVLVASPDYWPWYACMPVTLIIVSDVSRLLWLAILMSFTARLCAPLDVIRDHGFLGMVASKGALTGLGATLPLAVLLLWIYRQRQSLAR
jgi:alpha-1,6-mannosyltransferase